MTTEGTNEPTPSADQLRTPANYLAYGLRVLSKEYSSLTADTMQSAAKLLLEQERTIAELQEWKRQQLEVESGWDAQAVGKLLPNLRLGASIRPAIQPYLERVKAELAARAKTISELQLMLEIAYQQNGQVLGQLSDQRVVNERLTKERDETVGRLIHANQLLADIPHLKESIYAAEKRANELELSLTALGDLAVGYWDDATVGKVDALVPDKLKYKDLLRSLFAPRPDGERDKARIQQAAEDCFDAIGKGSWENESCAKSIARFAGIITAAMGAAPRPEGGKP